MSEFGAERSKDKERSLFESRPLTPGSFAIAKIPFSSQKEVKSVPKSNEIKTVFKAAQKDRIARLKVWIGDIYELRMIC